jgi:hypothetical protein
LAGALVVVAALVTLGTTGAGGRTAHASSAGPDEGALADAAQVQAVIPDARAVPADWHPAGDPTVVPAGSACSSGPDVAAADFLVCEQLVAFGGRDFVNGDNADISLQILAGPSRAWATRMYQVVIKQSSAPHIASRPFSAPALGDASIGYDNDDGSVSLLVQAGTTVLSMEYRPGDAETQDLLDNPAFMDPTNLNDGTDNGTVEQFAQMFAARSLQAQSGQTPTAAMQ